MSTLSACQYLDVGTIFRVTIQDFDGEVVDISPASTMELIFRRPNGSTFSRDASYYTDGTDGVIQYTSIAGDLNAVGTWKLQAKVTMPSVSWHTEVGSFVVNPNLA